MPMGGPCGGASTGGSGGGGDGLTLAACKRCAFGTTAVTLAPATGVIEVDDEILLLILV